MTLSPPEVLCACPLFCMGGDKEDAPSNPSCDSLESGPTHCSLLPPPPLFQGALAHARSHRHTNTRVLPTCLDCRSIHGTSVSHVRSCNHDQVWCNLGARDKSSINRELETPSTPLCIVLCALQQHCRLLHYDTVSWYYFVVRFVNIGTF